MHVISETGTRRQFQKWGAAFTSTALLVLGTATGAVAGAPIGACCYGISECSPQTELDCTTKFEGAYEGDGTICGDPGICGVAFCGNEIVESPEECDDGGTIPGDGCNEICKDEYCGDGTNNNKGVEECDDGNTFAGDGCNENCILEFCGDGVINNNVPPGLPRGVRTIAGEECDDGNTVSGDGCDGVCIDEFCGDGIVNNDNGETTEECDDGNTDNTDACLVGCIAATCGDGIENVSNGETVEECDDGGTAPGDGCSADCLLEIGACCHGSACDDGLDAATCASTYSGSYGGDGTTCADPGVCVNCGDSTVQIGEECDDGGTASGDGCDDGCAFEPCWSCDNGPGPDFGPSVCVVDDLQACDDGNDCTLDDQCDGGVCGGGPPIIPAACDWVMVANSPTGKPAQARARGSSAVIGDMCGQTTLVGDTVVVNGDVVATATSGRGSRFGALAAVVGDVITGGASIVGRPTDTLLPGLDTDEVPGGTTAVQVGDPTSEYDATGTTPLALTRVGECQEAIDSIGPSETLLDDLSPTVASLGKVHLASGQDLPINATGPLNVIDMDRLTTGKNTTITLNGNSIPDVVFVLRIDRKIYVKLGSSIVLTNGATPERVIIYGRDLCKFGQQVSGFGTVFCPDGKVKVDQNSIWDGSLISGRRRVDLRHQVGLTHVPLLVGATP